MKLQDESHEQGLFSNDVPVNGNYSYKEYSFESVDLSSLSKKTLKMHTDITSSKLSTNDELKAYISDEFSFVTSYENIKEVSKNVKGLRIGDAKDLLLGELTIKTSSNFKAVEIICEPYSTYVETLESTDLVVDQNVKLGIDNLGFQDVNTLLNDGEVMESYLTFNFAEPTNELNLICGPQRAIIKEINFYL